VLPAPLACRQPANRIEYPVHDEMTLRSRPRMIPRHTGLVSAKVRVVKGREIGEFRILS
jgi:hypothetical protein